MLLATSSIATAQGKETDAQALQAILSEIRGMHSEMRIQEARAETMQVLLFELQVQQTSLNRATQRADDARNKVSDIQDAQRHVAADLLRSEDQLKNTKDDMEKKHIEAEIEREKTELDSIKLMEQDRLTTQQQTNAQMQRAQTTLDTIQGELDQFMQTLKKAQQQASAK